MKKKHTLKQLTFYFSFEKPRRLRNSKLFQWEWRLYQTSVHLDQIFRARWWMSNGLSERRGWSANWWLFDGVGETRRWSAKWWLFDGVGERRRWSAKWWLLDGVGEEGEWEMRWSVRGRGWDWSGVCERDSEWESTISEALILKKKKPLFETESLRLAKPNWTQYSKLNPQQI